MEAASAPGLAGAARSAHPARATVAERPVMRGLTFTALALYGVLLWAKLTSPAPTARLLGLVALAVGIAVLGPVLARRHRGLAAAAGVAAALAALPISGVPLAWIWHVRIAVTADAIGQGLTTLPRIFLPYAGLNQPVRMVMTLGAGVLLLDAGLLLGFAPARLGDLRRGAVALPLIALAIIPATLMRPSLPYVQGALLFVLLAAFLWGERVHQGEMLAMVGLCCVAMVAALFAAPGLDRHRAWIAPQSLAGGLTAAHLEQFDWSQRYGPINWPRTGRAMFQVQAAHAEYWKAEDLDVFNGHAWTVGNNGAQAAPDPLLGVTHASLTKWTQTIRVTLGSMSTSTMIAAGSANLPAHTGTSILPGASPGTWVSGSPLGPGDSYEVTAYTPSPSAAQLRSAGTAYPEALVPYRTIDVPYPKTPGGGFPVAFASFHSGLGVAAPAGAATVEESPYGPAFALATRLASLAGNPYAFVTSVERYLSRGFTYDETPPARTFPLESFLFQDRLGYCQQFAGAMALLLRMGGIPARVAAGFTAGTYNSGSHRWVVTDVDAHAWVEAWFPHYGWVRFDPTPGAAPARGGHTKLSATAATALPSGSTPPTPARQPAGARPTPSAVGRHAAHGASSTGLLVAAAVLGTLLVLLIAGALRLRARRPPAAGVLASELERALARAGRPLSGGTTLAALEERLGASPQASAYVRAIRLARFGSGSEGPTVEQRRALRAQLWAGLGLGGALRAMWALPPGWPRQKTASRGSAEAYTPHHG